MAKHTSTEGGRSPGKMPYHLMPPCLKLGKVVSEHGGDRGAVPKSVVARALDLEHGSAGFGQLVASTKNFGIVDGGAELRLTEHGREYFFPTSISGKRLAELAFLNTPLAFGHLIKKYDGSRMPSTEMLANQLARDCQITESWKLRAAQIFVSTAQELGVLDQNRILRFEPELHSAGRPIDDDGQRALPEPESQVATPTPPTIIVSKATVSRSVPSGTNVWDFTEAGGTVRLETPDQIPFALWQRLKRYVEMLEPAQE